MKFSTRVQYGLKATLILASRYGEGSLSASQIAKREEIPVLCLEQILNYLKRKGFLKSVRGPKGGYILAKKPAETSLEKLFHTLIDKSIFPQGSELQGPSQKVDEVSIANWIVWKKLKNSFDEALSGVTLKDLIDEGRRIQKSKPDSGHYSFHI